LTQQPSKWAPLTPTIRVAVLGLLAAFLLLLPLALAPRAEAYVYWNSENGIGRANLDGTGVKKGFIKLADVADIAVTDRHIYWTRLEGMIGRARIDGTGVDPDFSAPRALGIATRGSGAQPAIWRWTRATSTGRPCGGIRARAPR